MKKENLFVILTGVVIGIAALVLTALGNPANMGFCIACFERDIAGAVGLHSAAKVQYVRPEIIGLVLGSFLMALASKEWKARAGSSSALRFVLGAFVMIGALAFLGCPLRMVLRLAGGDLNAVVGLAGFAAGIFLGTIFIRKGFTLQRNYATKTLDGTVLPAVMVGLLILFLAVPTLFKLSEEGPGSKPRPVPDRAADRAGCWRAGTEIPYLHGRRSARHDDVQGSAPAVGLHRHFRHSPHRQSLPA